MNMTHPAIRYTEDTGDTSLFHDKEQPEEPLLYDVEVCATIDINVLVFATSAKGAKRAVTDEVICRAIRRHTRDFDKNRNVTVHLEIRDFEAGKATEV